MTRAEFLAQKWNRYPLLPKGVSFIGRIHEIHPYDQEWEVTVTREGKTHNRIFPRLVLLEHQTVEADRLLIVGDLVAISDGGVVTLLAPYTQKLPPRVLRLEYLRLWQDYVYWMREYFREQGFVEVRTPSLVPCPGTEPSLDVFSTEFVNGSRRQKLYLPTSPELHLKKALALGAEKIFEIKNVFRNGEVTDHHQPEFTMIEWYRAYDGMLAIKRDVADLVNYLVRKMPSLKTPLGFDTVQIPQLFYRHCGYELRPDTTLEQMKALAEKSGVDVSSARTIDDYFFLIFMEKIETQFIQERLVFVEKYPPYQAALARLTADGWGDRFEVYWQGLELANAFHELNDPAVQKQRFAEDLAKKRAMGKEEISLDAEFMQCLEAGMPPSAGIALGVERLFMALTGIASISDTRLFPMK
ncbi:MAG: EF-P lysine aminoacylase GenX [Bdellovibrionales bacterium]|nr:EF-P lysine aminoacylase GenX [Bdellovibrionales bacterium]